jgi:hypothetical protein
MGQVCACVCVCVCATDNVNALPVFSAQTDAVGRGPSTVCYGSRCGINRRCGLN